MNTDVVIIGAGAAGLMAGAVAGEAGLAAVVLERRHRAGLKLLLCGNNRCNISHGGTAADLVKAYGQPVGDFLRDALAFFPPVRLRAWFAAAGMPTSLNRDRIYPKTEKADDVLHCFTDHLRDLAVPLVLNCPVNSITPLPDGGFEVAGDKLRLQARMVLIATGGVSYPKTGSVGDGQRFAGELGHSVTPFRAGLAGLEVATAWLTPATDAALPYVRVQLAKDGQPLASTEGNLLCASACLRGSAIFDATRLMARLNLNRCELSIDLFPTQSSAGLQAKIQALLPRCEGQLAMLVKQLGVEEVLCPGLAAELGGNAILRRNDGVNSLADRLKAMPVAMTAVRPLKEAIVTVGGVSLDDINPKTLESKRNPGLFFAGEVMDIDGPTGGYNLHAAFATAQLAIQTIKTRCPNAKAPSLNSRPNNDESDEQKAPAPIRPPRPQTAGAQSRNRPAGRSRFGAASSAAKWPAKRLVNTSSRDKKDDATGTKDYKDQRGPKDQQGRSDSKPRAERQDHSDRKPRAERQDHSDRKPRAERQEAPWWGKGSKKGPGK